MRNYSKQREAIIEVLRENRVHPTAKQVYELVRQKIPNISLGTVYRNLSELSVDGTILSLSVNDGFEHFDGDSTPHWHLHCRRCGKITDVPMGTDVLPKAADEIGFTAETFCCVVNGYCAECEN